MRRIWRSTLVVLIEKTPDYRYFIVLSIALLVLLLAACSKKPDSQLFDASDPLHYTGQRPVAPYTTTVAPTGSMEPLLHAGDVVHVEPIRIVAVKEGDLIAFWWEARRLAVLHTVIAKFTAANGEVGLVTKGFANSFPDPRVTIESELIGKATVQHVHP